LNTKSLFGMAPSALVVAAPAVALESIHPAPTKGVEPKNDAQSACFEMMRGSETADEARKAMREFRGVRPERRRR